MTPSEHGAGADDRKRHSAQRHTSTGPPENAAEDGADRVPALSHALLKIVLKPSDRPYALADLEEEFEDRFGSEGVRRARRWYSQQARRSIVPSLVDRLTPRSASRTSLLTRSRSHLETNMLGLWSDFRVAFRNHRRTPIATTVTVLSLGLGIGAVAIALTLLRQFVFPPPIGYGEHERLATLYTSNQNGDLYGLSSQVDFVDLRRSLQTVEDLAATSVRFYGLSRGAEGGDSTVRPEPLLVEMVSGNYFRVVGLAPFLGRGIDESDVAVESPESGAERVVVLGYDLWQSRFAADPEILGESIRLNGEAFTVIGVARDGIVGRRAPVEVDAWMPLGIDAKQRPGRYSKRQERSLLLLGHLKPNTRLEELQAEATVVAQRLEGEHPEAWSDRAGRPLTLTIVSEQESRIHPRVRRLLVAVGLFLIGAAALILLLACSNAMSLALARAAARGREIAIRRSLGSTRGHLLRLWLMDGLLPGLPAGVVGLSALWLCRRALASFSVPMNIPVALRLDVKPSVFVLVFALSLATSVLFALAPALAGARSDLVTSLKKGSLDGRRRRFFGRLRARHLPVLAQCASALVLLVGATMFVRSTKNSPVGLGFEPENIALASLTFDALLQPEDQVQRALELMEQLRQRPEVEQAAVGSRMELTVLGIDDRLEVTAVDSKVLHEDDDRVIYRNAIGPGYLELLEVPLVAGRSIAPTDHAGAQKVAVINETFANRFWPGEEAIGHRFTLREPPGAPEANTTPRTFEVVGIAKNGKYIGFDEAPTPYAWLPLSQEPSDQIAVLAKGQRDAASMLPLLQEIVTPEPGQMQEIPPSPLAQQVALQFFHLRLASQILGWAGTFGLLLAALGIYGIVSLAVQQQRRELAIRVAVGATRAQVLSIILGGSTRLVAAGLVLGLVIVVPLANLLRGVLVRVSPLDPLSLFAGTALLLAVGVVACVGPAREALLSDPLVALREE